MDLLQIKNEYIIYGLTKTKCDDTFFSKCIIFYSDEDLENILTIIQPDIVFHLASISSSEECIKKPIETLETNGLLVCKIQNIISKLGLNTKIINTCSCEIYKGNGTYEIVEDDLNYNPTYPYAFAKLLGHNMVKYYREFNNRWLSNALLFTTESPYRKDIFLIKKCAKHIKEWKANNKTILKLGNLNSYRNINHAYDVANALLIISKQDIADDYLVCSDVYLQVKDIIITLYKVGGIDLVENIEKGNFKHNNEICVEYNTYTRSFDANLNGKCEKLKKLGWTPVFDAQLIFEDLLR